MAGVELESEMAQYFALHIHRENEERKTNKKEPLSKEEIDAMKKGTFTVPIGDEGMQMPFQQPQSPPKK